MLLANDYVNLQRSEKMTFHVSSARRSARKKANIESPSAMNCRSRPAGGGGNERAERCYSALRTAPVMTKRPGARRAPRAQ